jgi:iron complex transport system substrate-binding protein
LTLSIFARTFFALLFVAATLPALAQEMTIEHAQGATVLPARPTKVLTFDLASLDILDALGVDVAGVPSSNIPDYLGKYRDQKYLKIGTLFQPDYEAVHAARPDLIIVAGRSAPAYRELAKIAPTIDLTLKPGNFMAGVKQNTQTLGRVFGKEKEASTLVARLDASVAKVREIAKTTGKALIVMTNGGKVTAYGKGSRFGWVHDDLGIEPAVSDLESATHGEAISFEFLLQTNPDWLFVLDRDSVVGHAGASARQTLDNELVAATTAAQRNQIVYVDSTRWYLVGGGINALQDSVDQLADTLSR